MLLSIRLLVEFLIVSCHCFCFNFGLVFCFVFVFVLFLLLLSHPVFFFSLKNRLLNNPFGWVLCIFIIVDVVVDSLLLLLLLLLLFVVGSIGFDGGGSFFLWYRFWFCLGFHLISVGFSFLYSGWLLFFMLFGHFRFFAFWYFFALNFCCPYYLFS